MHQVNPQTETPKEAQVVHPSWLHPSYFHPYEEEEINLLEYWRVLRKRKWQILAITFAVSSLVLVISLFLPKKYTSQASLLPISSSGSGGLSSMLGQLGSIPLVGGQLEGLGGLGGGKSKEIVSILKSQTLAEKTIQKLDLMKVIFAKQYDAKTNSYLPNLTGKVPLMEDAVKSFRKNILTVEDDKKSGLIQVKVTMHHPQLAANMVNGVIIELQNFIQNNSLTIAKRNRIFIEEQLVKNRAKLLESGKALNNFYSQNKISSILPELSVDVGSYQDAPKPLEEFQTGLSSIQQKQAEKKNEVVSGVPSQVYLQYLTLNRELLGKAHALLTQQYEIAKIEEAKEDLAFQVIDKGEVKVRPSSPLIKINLMIGLVLGLFLGVFLAFFGEYIEKQKLKH